MKFSSLAVLILFFGSVAVRGQSVARVRPPYANPISKSGIKRSDDRGDRVIEARVIAALKRLDQDVLVYHSFGDFEETGKLARVSFETFRNDLQDVTSEVEPILFRLAESRLKTEISNALDSYRDGAFWWQKIYHPRVVNVSALTFAEANRTPSDAAFVATIPYTVAIHWRQASKHLIRAEELVNGTRK